MKYVIRAIWVTLIYIGLFSLVALTRVAINGNNTILKPMFSFVSDVATDGENIYTLDDIFNRICKYSNKGDLLSITPFDSYGSNSIFCNKDGNLCRFDQRISTVYVYDDISNIIASYQESIDNLIDTGAIEFPHKTVDTNGSLTCKLNEHKLISSTVLVKSGDSYTKIVTESFGFHLFCLAFKLLIIAFFVFVISKVIDEKQNYNN